MMETLVTFLLTGSLIQGVLCGFNINLPNKVEALKGSCVFIPCTFDIEQQYEADLTDSAKRLWFKDGDPRIIVFNSSRPNTGRLKGEIFGTATQKNCTTRFDNVDQSHNGSYYFRLEANGKLQYNYKGPTYSQVEIVVLGSPPKPTLVVFKDQQKVMKRKVDVIEGSSVSLRCSTKIFCPSHPSSLTWSSSLIESVTGRQYQSQTELISDLNFPVSHRHHGVTFTCTATHQIQEQKKAHKPKQITKKESRLLHVQYAPKNTSVEINPAGLVLEGRSVTLICSSDANPAVNYTWYRDTERPLNPVQTGPNLTINNTDPTHSGRYYCTAENKHGTQNSSVLLDVQYAPKNTSVEINPAGLVLEGRSVTLICSSDANPAVNYTWYRDTERPLNPVQTGPNLTINNTNLTHSGRYYCTAENKHGTQNSSVLLDVQYAPKSTSVRINPAGLVLEGRSVTLICSSDANPAVNYTWYRDTERPLNPVQTGPNLAINNPDPTHSRRYYCTAENKHGTQNSSVLLDVQYAPKNTLVRINPAGLVLEGRSVTLICSSDANPAVNYTWYRETGSQFELLQTGYNNTYIVTNPTHGAWYGCKAQNQHGLCNATIQLDVQYAPKNTMLSAFPSSSVIEGNPVTLICSSDANPAVNYTWYRETGSQFELLQTGYNHTYIVTNPTHGAWYGCKAQNQHGLCNATIQLDVQYAPKNTSLSVFPSSSVIEGNPVTLICSSDANPAVNYTWYRDTERPLNPVQTGPNLTINNTNPTHSGRYYCTAENKHGTQNSSVLLDVQYAPKNTSLSVFPSSSVIEGNPVTLICSSDANPAVNYTWYRDTERPLNPVQTGPNLTINNTDPTHSGRYYCTAENKHGTQNSSVLLDVQYGPKNTSLSAFPSSSVIEGNPVTLICSSDANPAVNYTWYRETGSQFELLQTGYNNTYIVTNPTHGAWYGCKAQNQHGHCNATIQLDVQYAPKNTMLSAFPSSSVIEGNPVTLICSSDANPAVNYTWYRETGSQFELLQTGYNHTYIVTNPTHGAWYGCEAQNQHGHCNATIQLDVQYAPKNTMLSAFPSSSVIEGNPVTLICSSDANPAVNYTWYRETGSQFELLQTGYNHTYIVTNPTHGAWYGCEAQNQHGHCNATIQLDVQYAPKNTSLSAFPSSSVMRGNPVTLICSSDANPAVNYTWYRETGSQFELLQTGYNHTYIVTNPTHGAWYGCEAQNQHGLCNATIQLDVQFAPNISISCSRSSVTECVCEAHGNPCPTLEWRLSGRVITNSTETSISEETLGSTGVKSVLNIHQSLTDTDVLQCFSTNKYGSASASQQFQFVPLPQDTRFHHPSVLLGAAVGASVMMIACFVRLCYERRKKEKPSEIRQDDTSGLILTQKAVSLDNDSESVYANKGMLSSTTPSAPESLHYSSIYFTNTDPPSGEIMGFASLTSEYAEVRHCPAGDTDTENNTSTSETEPKKPDMTAKITDTSSPASEDVIYENTSHRYRQKEELVSADDAEKQD
ncbi:hemicentin-2 [Carassius gibelio]|uniref:hemicentin-2 n=1 Tax=Carassius gibelio TaxID=101364 RepID=UPI0022788CDC|nr:hemicentin-2 [Carassius gibelio]